jgi:hypothetical protein
VAACVSSQGSQIACCLVRGSCPNAISLPSYAFSAHPEHFRENGATASGPASGRTLPGVFFFYDLSPIKVGANMLARVWCTTATPGLATCQRSNLPPVSMPGCCTRAGGQAQSHIATGLQHGLSTAPLCAEICCTS